jgi:hypothetical protein
MKKDILLHYIFTQPNTTSFSGSNKKKVIIENERDRDLDFRDKCIDVLESFKYFCKNNSENFYHLFLPMNENCTRISEPMNIDLSCGIMQLILFNFTNDNFKNYSKKYIDLINELNGKDIFEEFDIWIREGAEHYSHASFSHLHLIKDYER